jgi:hypothetical protein
MHIGSDAVLSVGHQGPTLDQVVKIILERLGWKKLRL